MRLSKNMEWARPFLKAINAEAKVEEVSGYRIQLGKEIMALGRCHPRGDKFKITMCLNRTFNHATQSEDMPLEDLLYTLAHEIAHTIEWEHTPEHLFITAQLVETFAQIASKLGIENCSIPPNKVLK